MATTTFGSQAQTTFTAVPFPDLTSGLKQQLLDFAAINALIKDDVPLLWAIGNTNPLAQTGTNATQIASYQNLVPTALSTEGRLVIPNRGVLKVLPGDWIAVDTYGWPILVSGRSVQSATTSWVHS